MSVNNLRQSSQQKESGVKFPDINARPFSGKQNNSFREEGIGMDGNSNIQQSMTQQLNLGDIQSPFRLPSDEEVFLFRENERQKKQELKATSGNFKIWEKKTATNRTQLKHYKNFETKREEKFASKTAYSSKDKKLIQQALEVAKERQKNRENGIIKEPIVNLLEQKKEMFLVTKAHTIIQEEILKLKQTSEEKQLALELSSKMLEQDHENFQHYLENNKQEKVDAEMRAEAEIKEKKLREQEIKSLNIRVTSLKAEKARNEESVQNFKEHKDFLDKLAPKEWNDVKDKKRKEKIKETKDQWILSQLEKTSIDDGESHDPRAARREKEPKPRKSPFEQRTELERQFNKLVEQGGIDEVEEFDDEFEMFFKTPQQLVELFNDLEERNLFLIQTTQDAEQNLEELKTHFNKTKYEQDSKLKSLLHNKDTLKRNFDNVCFQIKTLQVKGSEKENKKDQKEMRNQIIDVYELFQSEINLHDYKGKDTLEILMAIELFLEKQLKQIRDLLLINPEKVEEQRQQCEKFNKNQQRDQNTIRLKQEQDAKTRKNQDKTLQPSKKKVGRQDMFRSAPQEKVEVKKVEKVDNDEEEDRKFFLD